MADRIPPAMFENVRIFRGSFRNFAGAPERFNKQGGKRHFGMALDPNTCDIEQMMKDGWNVKFLEPRDEGDPRVAWIDVEVRFGKIPPRITLISSKGRTALDEDTVSMLDYADIKTVDLTINPHRWEVDGNTGIKAYLRSMFVTIEEDELDLKYAQRPAGVPDNEPDFFDGGVPF